MMRRLLLACLLLGAAEGPAMAQSLPETVAIDVLIEPGAPAVSAAQAMNARLRSANPAGYALDATHAPHITLVQRYVRRVDLPKVEVAVAAVLAAKRPRALKLQAHGYTASDFGGGLLLLDVMRTPSLDGLAADVLAAVQPFAVSGGTAAAFVQDPAGPIQPGSVTWVENFATNASGAKFAPHITVGTAPFAFVQQIAAEPFVPFTFGVRAVAIYQLGNYGTAARKLWSKR
jgi:hypothetical protein